MPRTNLNRIQQKPKDFVKWLAGEMQIRKLTQTSISEILGVDRRNVSYKMANFSFTWIEMMMIMDELDVPREEMAVVLLPPERKK